jgi:hypothetical protein
MVKKTNLFSYLEVLSKYKNWDFLLTFICTIYIFISAFPPYYDLKNNELLKIQIENPITRLPDEFLNSSHEQKHQFRITVPIIAHFLKISGYWLLGLQYISSFLLLLYTYRLSLKICSDKVIATLSVICISAIYVGVGGYYDVFWHFDSLAILLLILAMYTDYHLFVFIFILSASFTDERAFIASALVFVFKIAQNNKANTSLADLFGYNSIIIIASWLTYFSLRTYLIYYHNFFTGMQDIGPQLLIRNYRTFPLNILFIFEGGWLFIWLGISRVKDRILTILTIASTLVIISISLMISDVSRSTSYLLPLFFIGLYACNKEFKLYTLRKIILVCTIISLIVPTQEFFNYTIYGMGAIFPNLLSIQI